MNDKASHVQLSLVSHTNAGKTTLARTLLGKDIGEVDDRPHVTAQPDPHVMIEGTNGETLTLWDTPGFGDSVRLAKRLRGRSNPIGWFLSEFWDRWSDKPLWSSQQAMKNVRDASDVVLYLVNAAEAPEAAAYIAAEMEILSWLDKPVLVLLNQIGTPRPWDDEEGERATWRSYMSQFAFVQHVLSLDAFSRCWVQEFALFDAIGTLLPSAQQSSFQALRTAWREKRVSEFHASINGITDCLAALASDTEQLRGVGIFARSVDWVLHLGGSHRKTSGDVAMDLLAERAAKTFRVLTDRLIEINELKGRAAKESLARMAEHIRVETSVSEGAAAVVGAIASGALSGLAADAVAGGLTLGGGAAIGALLGALGTAAMAKGYNVVTGKNGTTVRWNDAALTHFVEKALLLYLAVAHFGRGRGDWSPELHPQHWEAAIQKAMVLCSPPLQKFWRNASAKDEQDDFKPALFAILNDATLSVLGRLYPDAAASDYDSSQP